jgi:L-lactate dehydrogenase complex protein LldG
MDERLFLERVRAGLGGREGPVSSLDVNVPVDSERPTTKDALSERLARELEKVDSVVHRASSTEEARQAVSRILRECDAKRVVLGNTPLVSNLDLESVVKGAGAEPMVCDLRQEGSTERIREEELVADVGLTSADYGIAETGTLALLAAPGQGRAVSLLPLVHIAVLRESDIVYELSELFERIGKEHEELPSALTFITGPSRTADIELVLTVGVHGPKYLHLVLLENRDSPNYSADDR